MKSLTPPWSPLWLVHRPAPRSTPGAGEAYVRAHSAWVVWARPATQTWAWFLGGHLGRFFSGSPSSPPAPVSPLPWPALYFLCPVFRLYRFSLHSYCTVCFFQFLLPSSQPMCFSTWILASRPSRSPFQPVSPSVTSHVPGTFLQPCLILSLEPPKWLPDYKINPKLLYRAFTHALTQANIF